MNRQLVKETVINKQTLLFCSNVYVFGRSIRVIVTSVSLPNAVVPSGGSIDSIYCVLRIEPITGEKRE